LNDPREIIEHILTHIHTYTPQIFSHKQFSP